jgi:hypothetical protein
MADKRFMVILRQNERYGEMRPISMIAEWAKIAQCRFGPRSPITHVAEHTDEGTQTRRRSRGAAQRRWRVPSRRDGPAAVRHPPKGAQGGRAYAGVPRDYLSTFLKIGTIALLAVGIVIVRPDLQMPAVTKFIDGSGPVWAGSVFPFLFITIACGAVSGWHSLARPSAD